MSSRLTQVLLGLSLLLNCFVLAGFVYSTWIAPPHLLHAGPPPGQRLSPVEALSHDLKLSDDQRTALKPMFDQYAASRRERFREFQKIREQMSGELQKTDFDMAKIDPLIEQMGKLRNDGQRETLRAIAQLSQQLKPEQREQLKKILTERYSGPWPGRAGGGRPPR
jgi:Spy/CpxP family protein refolding chaperone